MKVFINAVSAQTGGALTYLRAVIPLLAQKVVADKNGRVVLLARDGAAGAAEIAGVEQREPGTVGDAQGLWGMARRIWFDQRELPRLLVKGRADALFSSANFGTLKSPVRQVLLVRNTVYFDEVLLRQISSPSLRAKYRAQAILARRTIAAADVVLYPTRAMQELAAPGAWKENWVVAPYGARLDLFSPAPQQARDTPPRTRLLHVSVYSEQKNLKTLLSATRILEGRGKRAWELRLTAGIRAVPPGPAHPNLERERREIEELEGRGVVTDLGPRPYKDLPELYRGSDIFVFPSYTESFGHPMVEAMASGVPVVAADTPTNREVCGDAAVYFETFSPEACAEAVQRVAESPDLASQLRAAGVERSRTFTWSRHVELLWQALSKG